MAAPVIHKTRILPEWLDYNDHLNVAFYVLIFDQAGEALLRSIGLGEQATRSTGISWVVLESHITYDREVTLGQEVEVGTQLIDYDHKRMHLYFEMRVKGRKAYLASTLEQMVMCVDLRKRSSTPFPGDVFDSIQFLAREQLRLGKPENLGRRIAIRR